MVRIVFDGELKSKGHPPSKWNLPKWLYRMFVWETKTPLFVQQDFEEGNVKFAESFGPKVGGVPIFQLTAGEFDGTVSVTLYAMGFPVVDYKGDISDYAYVQKIKWSASGQKLEGTLTVTLE